MVSGSGVGCRLYGLQGSGSELIIPAMRTPMDNKIKCKRFILCRRFIGLRFWA